MTTGMLVAQEGQMQSMLNEVLLARRVAEDLDRHYPNMMWAVNVTQGVLDIRSLRLSGKMGYRVKHINSYSSSDLDRKVMRAGGEILERYRVQRARMTAERATSKTLVLPVDFAGQIPFDK